MSENFTMSKETYNICSSWDKDVLNIVLTGTFCTLSRQDANEIAQRVIEIFDDQKPTKVLIDCTGLAGRLSIIDTFFHVREHKRSVHHPDRLAVLDTPDNEHYYSFHQIAALNVGLNFMYFCDRDEAMRWLWQ